jgi:hypothetical protein
LCEPKIGAVIMKVLWGNRLFWALTTELEFTNFCKMLR